MSETQTELLERYNKLQPWKHLFSYCTFEGFSTQKNKEIFIVGLPGSPNLSTGLTGKQLLTNAPDPSSNFTVVAIFK